MMPVSKGCEFFFFFFLLEDGELPGMSEKKKAFLFNDGRFGFSLWGRVTLRHAGS